MLSGCLDKPDGPDVVPPDGRPSNTFGLEQSIPQTGMTPADAVQLAAVCDEYARQIELDGNQSEPVIQTTKDLETRNLKMQTYAFGGRAVATQQFVQVVALTQDREFPQGEEAVPVDAAMRKKASEFYRAIAYSLRMVK
jgi:hypothetical protein